MDQLLVLHQTTCERFLADHRSVDTTLERLLNVSPGYNITCEYISEDAICREGQGVGSFSSGCWLMARVTSTGHMLLRSLRSSVLQRQPRTSKAFHYISPLHICGRTEWRHYSTHSPEGFKNKSAVGVSHSPIPPPFRRPAHCTSLLGRRCSPPKQLPFSS